ncbi:transposase [Iodidimonas muriae]|uniref:transposase n=1 Tax=Iodidimonas muriae TaxID=261467 RepID=UPI00227AA92B|nr:transposase [Iodidimonas muriae]
MAQKRHSEEFRREAVKLALTSGLPREAIEDDLRIGKSTLGKWITQYRQDQKGVSESAVSAVGANRARSGHAGRALRHAGEKPRLLQ